MTEDYSEFDEDEAQATLNSNQQKYPLDEGIANL